MIKNNVILLWALATLLSVFGCAKEEKKSCNKCTKKAKNIIFLIGDGMGVSQVSTAYYYNDSPVFSQFPVVGLSNTSSASSKVTDSAAGATVFSIGERTYNGAIGMTNDTLPKELITEKLSAQGYKTGVVATSSVVHATPAAFYAHVKSRKMYEKIASQLPGSHIDFFAAGGTKFFAQRSDNKDMIKELKNNGFVVDTNNLADASKMSADKKYGFMLAPDGMPSKVNGRGDFLPDATKLALNYFSKSKENFFLMVEGSQIDWAGHRNNPEMLIGEVLDFEKTVRAALEFAKKDGNTLVVVTADHETGGVAIPNQKNEEGKKHPYPKFAVTGHTATLVPVFAYGPGAEKFAGVYNNDKFYSKFLKSINN